MSTQEHVVQFHDFYGNNYQYSLEDWEAQEKSIAEYLGKCLLQGDLVSTGKRLLDNEGYPMGSYRVFDGSEKVAEAYWQTEEVTVYSDEELAEMEYHHHLENFCYLIGEYDD